MKVNMNKETTKQIIKTLTELVSFRTTASRLDELHACAAYLERFFADTSLATELYIHDDIPSLMVTKHTKKPKVLLYGHFDVVEGKEEQFTIRKKNSRLYGRGTLDMKSGVAIFLHILKKYHSTTHDIGLMLVGDEETGGFNGVKKLLDIGYSADVVLMPDGGLSPQHIVQKEKGLLHLRLIAKGVASHAAYPWLGKNAINLLLTAIANIQKIFEPLRKHPKDHWRSTISISTLTAGKTINKIPAEAESCIDIRITDEWTPKKILTTIRTLLPKGVEVTELISTPSVSYHVENHISDPYISILKELGFRPKYQCAHGASDARHFAKKNIPVLMSQPSGANHHGDNEYVDIPSLSTYHSLVCSYIEKVST